jgi:hypothetical protein
MRKEILRMDPSFVDTGDELKEELEKQCCRDAIAPWTDNEYSMWDPYQKLSKQEEFRFLVARLGTLFQPELSVRAFSAKSCSHKDNRSAVRILKITTTSSQDPLLPQPSLTIQYHVIPRYDINRGYTDPPL